MAVTSKLGSAVQGVNCNDWLDAFVCLATRPVVQLSHLLTDSQIHHTPSMSRGVFLFCSEDLNMSFCHVPICRLTFAAFALPLKACRLDTRGQFGLLQRLQRIADRNSPALDFCPYSWIGIYFSPMPLPPIVSIRLACSCVRAL